MPTERSRVSDLATWVGQQLTTTKWTTLRLASDVSTTAAAATDITALGVQLPAGLYEVRAGLIVSTAVVTTGPQIGLAWPSGATVAARIDVPSAANAAVIGMVKATGERAAGTGLPVINTGYLATIEATVRVTSTLASPGLRPTLWSDIAATAVTVKADSWLSYRRLV